MNLSKEVNFLSERPAAPMRAEVAGQPVPASIPQRVRANDLFLRSGISAEELAQAQATANGFEIHVGRSNLLPAVFLEVGAAHSRATCLLRTSGIDYRGRSGSWSGTGFLVSPNILLTNHHVINSPAVAAAATAVFNYQVGVDGQPLETTSCRLRPDRLYLTSPAENGLDYTFCWVDGEPGRQFGQARINRRALAIAEQEFANIVSHPDGRMKEIAIQENTVAWQDNVVVHYTSDTEPGSSGAAVCNNNWQLIALHHASRETPAPHPIIQNEGIKLSAIAADLERIINSGSSAAATARELLALFGGTDERLGFFGALGRAPAAGVGPEAVVNTFAGTEQDLDVGFWNVEWLTRNYEHKSAAVARVINALNLDVWAIEESSEDAARAVAEELHATFGKEYGVLAAEPGVEGGKQSCTILWNTETVDVVAEAWGEPIETWLKARSTDFDDLDLGGFEAVHGKIFDRYPGLFKVTSRLPEGAGSRLDFYLVPLHLKAMSEGSMRRKMASKILALAVEKKVEEGSDADFIIGGDANAELGSGDFANLTGGGLTAISAANEQGGAFSYIKGPRSLIDHVFLSPNLAERYSSADFFIVAAERSFPDFVDAVSDHRPVLLRMSLGGSPEPERLEAAGAAHRKAALAELIARLERGRGKAVVDDKRGDGYGGNRLQPSLAEKG
ncbi:MAG: trypsin-like peptidase domain-containing protein [Pirellulales bacterium]|nr:trypsin-like peptidase domain-containing protein [Pirellulales bacterium]